MKLRVLALDRAERPLRLRMPFRYGIATMTEAPHFLLRAQVEIDGRTCFGYAADNLPPKWFTKRADISIADELVELRETILCAGRLALGRGAAESLFDWWQGLRAAQQSTARERGWPPLLAGFGVSLVERALIDAFCRSSGMSFVQAVRQNAFGIRLEELHSELQGAPSKYLPERAGSAVIARHTVGLSDPLKASEMAPADRLEDGLPQALDECIRYYGLTHFKIKLSGHLDDDRARLHALAELLARESPSYAFTLDGNENFHGVDALRGHWESFQADPIVASMLPRLIFLEQPLHRDVALGQAATTELRAWRERPPMIIDESGADEGALETALDGGYAGISHKNCKGVIPGIAHACLLAARRSSGASSLHLSGEDLTNLGPVALLQDLAAAAVLGIQHVERNGHHYFAGLSEFPVGAQRGILRCHSDLYRMHPAGWPAVRIDGGRVTIQTVLEAPFGHGLADADFAEFDFQSITP